MLTPFNSDKSICWEDLDRLIEWYINTGSKGLFAVCQSSEMYYLTDEEKLQIATRVINRVDGKIPVIATGTFSYDIDEQAVFIKKMHDTGVDAVICLANYMAEEKDSEDVFKKNGEILLSKTENIPLGLYECPAPYHRLLEEETVKWAASTGRFYWMKETSENIKKVQAKTKATLGSNLSLYNAHTASLLESLRSGTIGFSGIAANFYPSIMAWITENFDNEKELANELNTFLIKYQAVVDHKYLSSAKQYLKMIGLISTTISRLPEKSFDNLEIEALKKLGKETTMWQEKLNLPVINSLN
jgi:4-hydroxy-tetrahydrodipicolinate synthase